MTACIFSPLFMGLIFHFLFFLSGTFTSAHVLRIYKSCEKCSYGNNFCLQVTFDVTWRCLILPAKVNLTFRAGEMLSAPHTTVLINQQCHVVTWRFIRNWVKADYNLCQDSLIFVLLCFNESKETLWRLIYLVFRNTSKPAR